MIARGNAGGGNHLARVVERARGDVDVAVPRVPGLFEPVERSSPALVADGSPASNAREMDDSVGNAGRLEDGSTRRPGDRFDQTGAVHAATSPVVLRSQGSREPAASGVPDNPIRRERLVPISQLPVAAAAFVIHERKTPQPERNPSPLLAPARLDSVAVREPREPPADIERDARPPHARAVFGAIDSLSPKDDSPRAGVLVAQRVVDAQAFSAAHMHAAARDPASGTAAPPDIHISIGRVEVRALVTPARTAAARATDVGSTTRLDAYLRRRERTR